MSYVEQLQSEHKARHARLFDPPPFKRKSRPKIIPIIGGIQFHYKAPAPKPDPVLVRDWLTVATGTFKATETNLLGPSGRPAVRAIARIVAAHFGLSLDEIVSHRRTYNVVRPRQIAMFLAKKLTLESFPQIGRMLGNRDHTTCLHACRKIEWLRSIDAAIDTAITQIEQTIAAKYPAVA